MCDITFLVALAPSCLSNQKVCPPSPTCRPLCYHCYQPEGQSPVGYVQTQNVVFFLWVSQDSPLPWRQSTSHCPQPAKQEHGPKIARQWRISHSASTVKYMDCSSPLSELVFLQKINQKPLWPGTSSAFSILYKADTFGERNKRRYI